MFVNKSNNKIIYLNFSGGFFILDFRAGFDCDGTNAVLRFRDFRLFFF